MNELIKELWDKVDLQEEGNPPSIVITSERELQKFAELIVKECMDVASPSYMSTPEQGVYYVEHAIDRIAEHFGVDS